MFNRYLNKLFCQYKNALGNKELSFQDESTKLAFLKWIKELEFKLDLYRLFLKKYGIINSKKTVLELDKGPFDTILKDEFMILSTQYASIFDESDTAIIINGTMNLSDKIPKVQAINSSRGIITSNISYFLTQNPYDSKKTSLKLVDIYNHKYNICLGFFGNIKDQDREKKIEDLKTFQRQVNGKYRDTVQDEVYMGLVYTNDNFKKTL